jgi:hypothetical protein
MAAAGCAGGQTGDTGTDETRCEQVSSYQITLNEARQRGLPVDAWLEAQLGKEQLLKRELPQLFAPVELWLDHDLVPSNGRMTSASVRIAPTGMVTVFRSRPITETVDPADCSEHAAAELRVEWQLPEMSDTLFATFFASEDSWAADDSVPMPYFGGAGRVLPKTPPGREPFSTYDSDFPAHSHGYFGTDRCSTLQPLPLESTTGQGVDELLAASGLTEQLTMSLECADMLDPEAPVQLAPRELSVSVALPEEFCPPIFLPGEIAAVGHASVGDERFDTMNAWVRVADAKCLDDPATGDVCRMVTVAMARAREDARSRGAVQPGGIMNGFIADPGNPSELQLQLQLRDGERVLFARYDTGYAPGDAGRMICSGRLSVSPTR